MKIVSILLENTFLRNLLMKKWNFCPFRDSMGFKSAARSEISNLLFKLANTQRSNLNGVYFWEDRIFPISLHRWLAFQESFFCCLYFSPSSMAFHSLAGLCSIRAGPLLSPLHTGCLQPLYGSFCSFVPFQHSLPFSFLAVFRKQCGFLFCQTGIIPL